jgi:tetratricopeptide (TPR) repeat protein
MLMKRTAVGLTLVLSFSMPWQAPEAAPRRSSARMAAQKRTPEEGTVKRRKAPKEGAVKERAQATPGKGKWRKKKEAPPVAEPTPVVVPAVEPEPPAQANTAEQLNGPATASTAERPWAQGVSQENQQAALELFRAGNVLLKDSVFVDAIGKYRQALALWDHPAIHYNLALALLNLDQPLEVHEHLVAATKYGAAPLDTEKLEHARAYKGLIEKQLARVEIVCEEPGASVVMDGRPLFQAPGRFEGLVRAGPHTITASKEGHLTNSQSRALPAGEKTSVELKLFTADDLTQYRRKWSAWKPWAVVGTGVALAAGGALLHMQARDNYEAFDLGVTSCGGCVPDTGLADRRTRGDTMQTLAMGGYAVGGAALVTGVVLVYMNRLQPYRVDDRVTQPEPAVTVAPLVGGGSRGVSATLRF